MNEDKRCSILLYLLVGRDTIVLYREEALETTYNNGDLAGVSDGEAIGGRIIVHGSRGWLP
jgi:hypothetical protein